MEEILNKISYYVDNSIIYFKIILGIILLLYFIKLIIYIRKKMNFRKWKKNNFMNINYIRRLDGFAFESYVENQLKGIGFSVEKTSSSYDFGVDLFLENKYAVQLKNYTGKVGIAAIQEIYAGSHYYEKIPVVLATNHYTKSAIELAEKLGVELIDLDDIKNWGNRYYTRSYIHKTGIYEVVENKLLGSRKRKVS